MENGIIDNQEDSIVLNKAAIDRGLFDADTLKKYGSVLEMNPSTSSDDIFMKPDRTKVTGMTQGNYEKINEEGFISEETFITDKDMIIGKVSPIQPTGDNKVFKDKSEMFKSNVDGYVDRVHHDVYDGDGYKMVNMRVRMERVPIIGDKFCLKETSYIQTNQGWKQLKDLTSEMKVLTMSDDLYYSKFTELFSFDCENELMFSYSKDNLIIETTLEHKFYARRLDKSSYEFITAREIYDNKLSVYVKNMNQSYLLNPSDYKLEKYSGKVMCPTVPRTHLFLYKDNINSIPVWTGNSTRFGQKGTLGLLLDQRDMPFTEEGMIPDIIFNPHGYPSRETVGQLLETICGKYAAATGKLFDGTPFDDYDVYKIPDLLKKIGYHPYGIETMYNGMTGQKMKAQIFIGPVYYMRLKHMVNDKMHCLSPDHEVLTENGWKNITDITTNDKVASLVNNNLEYHHPIKTFEYDYQGKMYSNELQTVTPNHKLYLSEDGINFYLREARTLEDKAYYYKLDDTLSNENIKLYQGSWIDYNGKVYCVEVPGNVFYVRNNGIPSWTGNSRSTGPKQAITRQPLEGRAKDGGLKIGEKICRKVHMQICASPFHGGRHSQIAGTSC
jgi:hypothetical protein